MRSYLVYRVANGVPRRVLSLSSRVTGKGNFHEGDCPEPKEFSQSSHFLSEGQRPTIFRYSEEDMTPEWIAEKAEKYNMLPEDYYPLALMNRNANLGDYPVVLQESFMNRSPYFEWDDWRGRRVFGQPLGLDEPKVYGPFNMVYDGAHYMYGFWQWWQFWRNWFFMFIFMIFMFPPLVWQKFNRATMNENSFNQAAIATCDYRGKYWYHKDWSHNELEFKDMYQKMVAAKKGYPNVDNIDEFYRAFDSANFFFGATGPPSGRDRHGPTGSSMLRRERQDTYMCPAGSMAFKFADYTGQVEFGDDAFNKNYDGKMTGEDYSYAERTAKHAHHGHSNNVHATVADQIAE